MRTAVLHRVRQVVGCASVALILLISLRVAAGAAAHSSFLVPSGRRPGYPPWMRGPLSGHAGVVSLRAFVVLMSVMAVAWVVTLLCASALPRFVIPAAIVIATAIFMVAPPLLSSDVFNYIAYGRLAIHGINPYSHGPVALMTDPVYPYTGHLWKRDPSAYGPGFTFITQLLAPLGTAGALWALKALAGLASLGCAALVWLIARRLGRPPALAAAFFALNPLVLVYAVGGAHNDLLMALFVAASVYLAVRGAAAWSGATLVGALLVKLSAGLVLPFLLIGSRARLRTAAGFAGAAMVAVAGSFAVYGTAPANVLHVVSQEQRFNWMVVSVPGFVGHYLGFGHLTAASKHVFLALFAATVVALAARAIAGLGWLEAAAAATFVLLVTTGWLLPWYIVWVLPMAAVLRRRALPAAVVGLTLLLLAMQLDHFWLTRHSHRHVHHHLTAHHHRVVRNASAPTRR